MKGSSLDKTLDPQEAEGDNMFNKAIRNGLLMEEFPFLSLTDITQVSVKRIDENLLQMFYDNFKGDGFLQSYSIHFIIPDGALCVPREPFILGILEKSKTSQDGNLRIQWGETIAEYIYRYNLADILQYIVVYYYEEQVLNPEDDQEKEITKASCTVYKTPKNTTLKELMSKIEHSIREQIKEEIDF